MIFFFQLTLLKLMSNSKENEKEKKIELSSVNKSCSA